MKRILTLGALILAGATANAEEGLYMQPAAQKAAAKECSACHMAYPAGFLPKRSWKKIMSTLDNHFGDNASLDDATRKEIESYLVANAADAGGRATGVLRGVKASDTPLRITDMPWYHWVHDHEVSNRWKKKAGSMSNCAYCHQGADQGYYSE